eukprot:237088_1
MSEQSKQNSPCKFYGSVKGCKFGDKCMKSHSQPHSVPLCKLYISSKGCRYGDKCYDRHKILEKDSCQRSNENAKSQSKSHAKPEILEKDSCQLLSYSWSAMMKDLYDAKNSSIRSQMNMAPEQKKAICILRLKNEPKPKLKFINLSRESNQSFRKLQSLLKSNEHIVYISRTNEPYKTHQSIGSFSNVQLRNTTPIRIIGPDLLPRLKEHRIIYPKSKSKSNRIEMIMDNNAFEMFESSSNNNNNNNNNNASKQRSITILYIRLPNDPHPTVLEIPYKAYTIGEIINYNFISNNNYNYINVLTPAKIINFEDDEMIIEMEDLRYKTETIHMVNICSDRIKVIDFIIIPSISLRTLALPAVKHIEYHRSIYYKYKQAQYIILCDHKNRVIFRYDIINKSWCQFSAYPSHFKPNKLDPVCFVKQTNILYIMQYINYRSVVCAQFNVTNGEWIIKKCINLIIPYELNQVYDLCYIQSKKELRLITGNISAWTHYTMIEQYDTFNIVEHVISHTQEELLDLSVWMYQQERITKYSNKIQFYKLTNKNQNDEKWNYDISVSVGVEKGKFDFFGFETILLILVFKKNCFQVKVIDFITENVYETSKYYSQQLCDSSFCITKTDDNYLHFIGIQRLSDSYSHREPISAIHQRISLYDLLPKKLQMMYNPNIVYGYCKSIKQSESSRKLVNEVLLLIVKYFTFLQNK